MRVSYAGLHAETPTHRETSGTWEVSAAGWRLYVVLKEDSGKMESLRIEKAPGGMLKVDGDLRVWITR